MTMRTRESSQVEDSVSGVRVGTNYINNVVDYTTSEEYSWIPKDVYSTFEDFEVPNFHARSARGEIFCNPMKQTVVTTTRCPVLWSMSYVRTNPGDYFTWSGPRYVDDPGEGIFEFQDPEPLLQAITSTQDVAVTKSWANASLSKTPILVTLGEGKETVEMGVQLILRAKKYLNWLRKKKYIRILKSMHPKHIPDLWMEVRYGIRPIIFDAMSIVEALQKRNLAGQRQTFRGFKRSSELIPEETFDYGSWGIADDRTTPLIRRSSSLECTARAGVLTDVLLDNLALRFGVGDPIQAIHDLTTLSFALDWILNVGDTIAAFSPKPGLEVLASWVVCESKMTQRACVSSFVEHRENWPSSLTSVNGTLHSNYASVETYTKQRIPSPDVRILPRFDVRLNAAKLIDLGIITRNLSKMVFRR